ncbi:L-threonylcarbamoyladenylate synthase [Paenibacillus tarimensis]|uniref:L-threonylcarbamoyladenylate synthase n=1 Tax=Paenibacillus tarimensis TaxID=416012 RepID=UPI001F43EA71|nr:L-threonylcarbamoyladenylate synthase [Paenibacillus tarimensis]MCF2944191.1 threonylcarbamoyl-AMP synthase [Paenibacillus tarimensis]
MKLWRIPEDNNDTPEARTAIEEASALLRAGGVVAFPTETVYGLGCDAVNTEAVERVFAAKGRPSDNPLIVHIAAERQLEPIVKPYSGTAAKLMAAFWPGPLTIVLPARQGAVSPRVTAGLDTVAVRMPAHETALRLIAAAGCPIAAPSANRSGRPSPTRAGHVQEDLEGRIDGLVDGGPAAVGLESTVVEAEEGYIRILRPGSITAEELAAAGGCEVIGHAEGATDEQSGQQAAPRSPGMKYTHYAPAGAMTLVAGAPEAVSGYIMEAAVKAAAKGRRTGVLVYEEHAAAYEADAVLVLGSLSRPADAARTLYDALRTFDQLGIEEIWAQAWPLEGIGAALMNRLTKAAGGRLVQV